MILIQRKNNIIKFHFLQNMIICLVKVQVAQTSLLEIARNTLLMQCLLPLKIKSPLLQIFFSDLDEIPGLGGDPEEPTAEEHRAQAVKNKALEMEKVRLCDACDFLTFCVRSEDILNI